MNILDAIDDPAVFAPLMPAGDWRPWRAFVSALFGLPHLDTEAVGMFMRCTGRREWPEHAFAEAYLPVGRRGGKSFTLALIAVYLAAFRDYRAYLGPGERATVLLIASDRKQARVLFRYCLGLLQGVPMLARLIEGDTVERIDLSTRVTIEVATASHRSTRGYSLVAALCDEIAFWGGDDAASPDTEILAALRPALTTIPNAMLLCASSPYGKRGALWSAYERYHGRDDAPALVWQASTRDMRPSFPQRVVDDAYAADHAAASAEYGGQFRSDVAAFLDREALMRCVPEGEAERAPMPGTVYSAFADPSGGSSDSMTLAIGHREGRVSVLDLVREFRPPFSPDEVVGEIVADLKRYGLSRVVGDRYAGEWVREPFTRQGITYELSERTKGEIYRAFLPLVNSRQAELLAHDRMLGQFLALDRRTGRFGRDIINHPPGGHDDIANAAAGVLVSMVPNEDPQISTADLVWSRKRLEEHNRPLPDWVRRGELYPPGDHRWKLEKGQKWLADRGRTE